MTYSNRRIAMLGASLLALLPAGHATAQEAPQAALKIDVATKNTAQTADVPVEFKVVLKDVKNQPAAARADTKIKVEVVKAGSPAGPVQSMDAVVKAGSTSTTISWKPTSSGLFQVKAREGQNELLDGTGAFLVQPPAKVDAPTPAPKPVSPGRGNKPRRKSMRPARDGHTGSLHLRMRNVACQPLPTPANLPPAPAETVHGDSAPPELHMMVSGRDLAGTFADGIEYAKVDVFYVTSDGSGAPGNIKVWLSWHGGEVKPQPLVIAQGSSQAQAQWSAQAPVVGTVQISAVSPTMKYTVDGETQVKFVRPVKGLQINGPRSLSFIEAGNLAVGFLAPDDTVVASDEAREVAFSAETMVVRVDAPKVRIAPGDVQASISFSPVRFAGRAVIRASAAGFKPITHTVEITWLGCLVLTLVGGALGGVMRYLISKGVIQLRLVVGVVMGCFVVLGFVAGIVQSDAAWFPQVVKHNQLSVPLAAFLGGWLGLELLDRAPFALAGVIAGKKAKPKPEQVTAP